MILLDFIKIELALHAKAIDLYTSAYNDIREIDEEQDLEVGGFVFSFKLHILLRNV